MARKKNVIAPNEERSVVAMNKMANDIEKAREKYGDGLPFEEERILDCIVFRAERTSHEFQALGEYCLWYKIEVGHGRFVEGLKRRNIEVRGAYWAMAMVEKFGDKFDTVSNLGARKARLLTTFTKEEIDEYLKGGTLGAIPHDDVERKTYSDLADEVRRQRKKSKAKDEDHKAEVKRLNETIADLRIRAEDPMQLTDAQRAHQLIRKKFTPDYTLALAEVSSGLRKAISIIADAERTEGIGVQELNEWLNTFVNDSLRIRELMDEWRLADENPNPVQDNFFDIIEGKAGV